MTGIRDRLQRYSSQEYPSQIALATRLVAPTQKGDEPAIDNTRLEPLVEYTPANNLRPKCGLLYIATRAELEQWLAALRVAAEAELDKGEPHHSLRKHNGTSVYSRIRWRTHL